MQPTLKDIASLSGFSITTVSRALAGYDDVSEQTRQRILQIAEELGYQPNIVARQLRGQRTHTIGIVIPATDAHQQDDFFGILIKGITHAAAHRGYDLLISAQLPEADEMEAYRRIAGGKRVDGMVLARTHINDVRLNYLRSIKHPFVVAGRAITDQTPEFPFIEADNRAGLRLLVDHFIAHGHRHIAIILPPESVVFRQARFAGYCDALAAANIPLEDMLIETGDLTREGGAEATHHLLARAPHITAIAACNDMMALGALWAVEQRGLQPGKDISIGGFDDIPAAAQSQPALTTISQPIYQIGEQLVEMLLCLINDEPIEPLQSLIPPRLVVRDSSGYPRTGT